jgi:hypothetical protein
MIMQDQEQEKRRREAAEEVAGERDGVLEKEMEVSRREGADCR